MNQLQGKTFIHLSELTGLIQKVVASKFTQSYWVLGEVSSHTFKENNSWHFFDFIEKPAGKQEPNAKIAAVAWKQGSKKIDDFEKLTGQKFTNGLQVLLLVNVEFQALYGVKLTVEDIDADYTLGSLEKQRRETLANLSSNYPEFIQYDGVQFLTKNKKTNFPIVIQRLALIASLNSDGFHDFQHTLLNSRFNYTYSIDVYPSSVQGSEAEKSILTNLISIFNSKIQYHAVVLIRGGGAKTDFLVFDSFKLSLAVAKFPIPIITGIGHHKDESIVDLMAKTSTKTPTKAAEFIISHNRQFEESILSIQNTIVIQSQKKLAASAKNLNAVQFKVMKGLKNYSNKKNEHLVSINRKINNNSRKILFNKNRNLVNEFLKISRIPSVSINKKRIQLANTENKLQLFTQKKFQNQYLFLQHIEKVVKILSPENTLKRGFAIVSIHNTVITEGKHIQPGSQISVEMKDTVLVSQVIKNENKPTV